MVTATQTTTVVQHQHQHNLNSNGGIAALKLRANGGDIHSSRLAKPLQLTGAFERNGYSHFEVTPAIGQEFERDIDLAELLQREDSPETDELWRELAALVSHRGVVFFRKQTNLTQALLNKLATKISHASGKPTASKLHIHPLSKEFSESGQFIGGEKIDSEKDSEGRQISFKSEKSNLASAGWHTDISFEPIPSDYAMLQLRTLPRTGGDTMWSSMYSAYDALSPHMRVFLEGLTATHDAEEFREQSAKYGFPLYTKERGHPDNTGDRLRTSHPVIRTNPVTGLKALYVNKSFTKRIDQLSIDESDALLAYLFRLVAESFDFQVRFRWEQDDLCIWDNRSTQHSGIFDFGKAKRSGDRVCSLGEKPFLNPNSASRQDVLGEDF